MNAAIDAGNTRIKIGIFENESLKDVLIFPSEPTHNFYSNIVKLHFENCIISSVIALPGHIINYIKIKSDNLIILNEHTKVPIVNKYKAPQTIGKDRIALSVGGYGKYPDKDVLIISAGTCITYNFVSAKAVFTGGAISPGLQMRLNAMHNETANLPLIQIDTEPKLIENTTEGSMASGVINGIIFEIEGFVNNLKKTHKNCNVILSGGDSRYLASKLTIPTEVEPDLALLGLNLILRFNAAEKN